MSRWTVRVVLLAAAGAAALVACSHHRTLAVTEPVADVDAGMETIDAEATDDGPVISFDFDATGDSKICKGLQCKQTGCGDGGDTTLTGTVYAPNGQLPIYNAIVYVPNDKLAPLPKGITCDQCGAVTSGSPIAVTLSEATGKFTLTNVPADTNVPLVVQLGKWRRQVTIPEVKPCVENVLTDPELTRLPRTQQEGNMPHVALVSGGCDKLGCMLPKVGIDPGEFGVAADGDAKAVHIYRGSGGGGPNTAGAAKTFWNDFDQLKQYDLAVFSCECSEAQESKGAFGSPAFQAVTDYLAAGGRIFTTDFQYTWYRYSPDPALGQLSANDQTATGIGMINGGAPTGEQPIALDTSFPKGKALADWLGAAFPTSAYAQVSTDDVFDNIRSLESSKTQTWGSSGTAGHPRVFTVNTPVSSPLDKQCGKGVHIDAHVNQGGGGGPIFGDAGGGGSDEVDDTYPLSCKAALKQGEAMFAFFFFDLASCIQKEDEVPKPPPPVVVR